MTSVQMNVSNNLETVNNLICDNKRLVYYVYNKLHEAIKNLYDKEDLIQAGFIGLFRAAKKFDSRCTFAAYAIPAIRNEMLMETRKYKLAKAIPKSLTVSLNEPISAQDDKLILSDVLSAQDGLDKIDLRLDIENFMKLLNDREILILSNLYYGMSQQELADVLKVSQACVSRTLTRIRIKFKEYYNE